MLSSAAQLVSQTKSITREGLGGSRLQLNGEFLLCEDSTGECFSVENKQDASTEPRNTHATEVSRARVAAWIAAARAKMLQLLERGPH
ncbi:hypothetical protein NDU88_001898 [Pleurodeles waltl]|uniref:MHC class I-like antigen recognition-like domain-containing protein n=1 Tax=Pleurodeles waltl TaxID=8319 RepID=A0AAV7U851_PLEWA|nr:hypothetical protein NDU88_001898 [Pleurodeles waltl]